MKTTIVIKVKFGKTLRRFNARVNEAGKMELSFSGLREKVLFLFKLSPEVDLTLTYLDEDGDSVTLADDENLHDVTRQSLDPLRIKAKVNGEKGNTMCMSSSANSTPQASPRVSHPLPNLINNFSEIFKAVPEPIEKSLSKLSLDLSSKDTSSSSQPDDLVQLFSQMMQTHMITASESRIGSEGTKPSPMLNEPDSFGGDETNPNVVAGLNSANQPLKFDEKVDPGFSTRGKNIRVINLSDVRCKKKIKKFGESSLKLEAAKLAWENTKTVSSSVLGTDDKEVKKPGDASPFSPHDFWNKNMNPEVFNQNIGSQCSFSGIYSQGGVGGICDSGVQCDGCGVHPITGPWSKSKVKHDYDLGSICFAEMGSETDYIRLDRPIPNRHSLFRKRVNGFNSWENSSPTLPQALTGVVKPNQPKKLDSRFVTDVNVIDGITIPPSAPFTKIWRMRNSGDLIWPQGTQLVWIGGERLSDPCSASLQIPADGLAVDDELEVAVDFIAPELPGRYISYWRMALPSGQEFGQRIWVLIQISLELSSWEPHCDAANVHLASGNTLSSRSGELSEPVEDEPNNNNDGASNRPRFVWTVQLHKRFLDAVAHLGIDNVTPKTILQMMNVEGLKRENVASHLQKYRRYLMKLPDLPGHMAYPWMQEQKEGVSGL